MGSSESITYSEPIFPLEESKGETPPYRFPGITADDKMVDSMPNGDKDLNSVIEHSLTQFASNPCLGTREMQMEETTDEEGNVKQVPKYGKYKWKTYEEVYTMAKYLARSFVNHNLCPEVNGGGEKMRMIGLYSKNREEW